MTAPHRWSVLYDPKKAFPFGEGGTAKAVTEEVRRRRCLKNLSRPVCALGTLPKGEGQNVIPSLEATPGRDIKPGESPFPWADAR